MDKRILNLPNLLTISRFLLSPVFFYFLLVKKIELALVVFMFVAVTDFADGWIARTTKQKTKFGESIDPMADKFMVFLAVAGITISFGFPAWAVPLFLLRDIVSLAGSVLVYAKNKSSWSANRWGKITTFLQVVTIVAFIIQFNYRLIILWTTIAFSLISALTYFGRGISVIRDWNKT